MPIIDASRISPLRFMFQIVRAIYLSLIHIWNARGDDHHVRIGRRLVVVGCAYDLRVEIHQRRALVHVQHLAFRETLLDVDEDHFARHLAASHHVCTGCTYGACTYDSNF